MYYRAKMSLAAQYFINKILNCYFYPQNLHFLDIANYFCREATCIVQYYKDNKFVNEKQEF